MKNEKIKMKNLIIGMLCFSLSLLFSVSFALANNVTDLQPAVSAKTITSYTDLAVTKTLTIGTKTNKGKIYIKGAISNPNKKKPVLVKDNLKVTGDLEVKGKIKGISIVNTTIIKDGAITGAKIQNATITDADLASFSVTTDKIADNAVTSAKIADGTITGSDVSSSADLNINTIIIGGGKSIVKHISKEILVLGPPTISAQSCGNLWSGTVEGVIPAPDEYYSTVVATPQLATDPVGGIESKNLSYYAYISAIDTVTIRACNPSVSNVSSIGDQAWQIDIWKHNSNTDP